MGLGLGVLGLRGISFYGFKVCSFWFGVLSLGLWL